MTVKKSLVNATIAHLQDTVLCPYVPTLLLKTWVPHLKQVV